jgi:sugar lactone lactonase YvrE
VWHHLAALAAVAPPHQGLPKGRLLAYYPHNRTTHVISHEFYYSNGVALSADGTYAAVCETDHLRVLK